MPFFTITVRRKSSEGSPELEFHFHYRDQNFEAQIPFRRVIYGPNPVTEKQAGELANAAINSDVWVCCCDPKLEDYDG